MKLKSIFFYHAVQVGSKHINSAHEKDFDLSFEDGLAFVRDNKQNITIAVPQGNIPQMVPASYAPEKVLSPLEKARLAKAAKAQQVTE